MEQMHADLMVAPGFQPQADERAVSGGLLDAVMRHGALAAGADRALCAAPRRAIGASMTPSGCAGMPSVTARYSRMKLSLCSWRVSRRWAWAWRATQSRPLVPLSSRLTG